MLSGRYTRRHAIRLGAGFAAAAAFAACSGGPSSAGDASAGAVRLRPRPGLSGSRPAPGLLRLGRVVAAGTEPPAWGADDMLLVYSRLVAVDPRGPTVYGDLARAVEQPDPLTVRFTLRDSLRFHADADDAMRPLTADAIQQDFQRRAAEGSPLFTEVVDRVETPDNRSVVLRLKAPFGLLFELLAAPAASIRGERFYKGSDVRVGSGAFAPVQREAQRSRYAASTLLSGANAPLLAAVDVVGAGAASELDAAFTRGEIDVRVHPVGLTAPPTTPPGTTLQQRPAQRMRGLGLSLLPVKNGAPVRSVEAFQNPMVRRAVALALDRAALRGLDGAYTAGPVGPAHAGDALPAAELEAHPLYRRDPAAARALLRAAGFDNLAFRLSYPDQPLMLSMAQIVSDNLRTAGFMPRPQSVPFADWQTAFLAGDFESVLFDLGNMDTPDLGLRLHTTGGLASSFSPWGYSNPVYDAAVRDALSALDPAQRAERSRAAQRLLLDDVPAMFPISAPPEYALVQPGVGGYEFDAYGFNAGYLSTGWTAPAR